MNTIFIGRHQEIAAIQKAILGNNELQIVLVHGQAGVGKTTLLQYVVQEISEESDSLIIGDTIIDFDDNRYKFLDALLTDIAQQIGSDYFESYFQVINARREAEQGGASPARIRRLSVDTEEMFVEDLRRAAKNKRIVIRFDTAEKIIDPILEYPDGNFWETFHPFIKLIRMIVKIPNMVLVVAGRTVDALQAPLSSYINDANIQTVSLKPFSFEQSAEILQALEKEKHIIFDENWFESLYFLTGGLPIILHMVADWVKRDLSAAVQWLAPKNLLSLLVTRSEKDSLEIRKELDWFWFQENAPDVVAEVQSFFRKKLISHLADLRTREDLLIVTLAKVNPLDTEGISAMLSVSVEIAKGIMDDVKLRPDVKVLPDGRIRLTDAMEELVIENIWPVIDEEGNREYSSNKKAAKYLDERSESLLKEIGLSHEDEELAIANGKVLERNQAYNRRLSKEQEFWIVRTEYIRRLIKINAQEGVEHFLEDFERANQFGYIIAQEALLGVISPLISKGLTPPDLLYLIEHKMADFYVKSGKYKEASEIFDSLLEKHSIDDAERIDLLIGQGTCMMRSPGGPGIGSSIRRAIEKYHDAERIALRIEKPSSLIGVLLRLGWSYRTFGHLHEAEDFYNQCYRLAILSSKTDYQALAANGMSYVYALLQDIVNAEKYSNEAVFLWKKMISTQPANIQDYRNRLAQTYNTSGEINIELGKPQEALRFFESAVEIFSELGIDEWLARSFCGRGYAKWLIGKKHLAESSLYWEDALKDLDRAYQLSTNLDVPLMQRRRANIESSLENYVDAIVDLKSSLRIAQQVGDVYNEYRCLCDLLDISLSYDILEYADWNAVRSLRNEYLVRNPDVNFPHLDGVFFTLLAHKALLNDDVDDAINLYKRGLGTLSQYGTFIGQNLLEQLEKMDNEIFDALNDRSLVQRVGVELLAFWQRHGSSEEIVAPFALGYFIKWSNV